MSSKLSTAVSKAPHVTNPKRDMAMTRRTEIRDHRISIGFQNKREGWNTFPLK
jgi:hypothetical protein